MTIAIGEKPTETTMMAHAMRLAVSLAAKATPWKAEFAEYQASAALKAQTYARYAKLDAKQVEQQFSEWVGQDFGGHGVKMFSDDLLSAL